MTTYSKTDLFKISPAPIQGGRDQGFLQALSEVQAKRPIDDLLIQDPLTCPVEALPALIAEYSLEEFIQPGLPENTVRKIIAQHWRLHEGKGYDDGVRTGLATLGVEAEIVHWHQMDPQGPPNTQDVIVQSRGAIYPETPVFSERELIAIKRMVEATKRFSQETRYVARESVEGSVYIRSAVEQKTVHDVSSSPVGHASAFNSRMNVRGAVTMKARSEANNTVLRRA